MTNMSETNYIHFLMLKTSCFNLERPIIGLRRQLWKHVHSHSPSHCVYVNHGSFVQACGFFMVTPPGSNWLMLKGDCDPCQLCHHWLPFRLFPMNTHARQWLVKIWSLNAHAEVWRGGNRLKAGAKWLFPIIVVLMASQANQQLQVRASDQAAGIREIWACVF